MIPPELIAEAQAALTEETEALRALLNVPGGIRGYETILPLLCAANNETDVREFIEATRARARSFREAKRTGDGR
jgi:hypothetical protein